MWLRRLTMRRTALLLLLLFASAFFSPLAGVAQPAPQVRDAVLAPAGGQIHLVSYVESSSGLIPPTMEGGRTEVEMGDVNGDGYLDLVSIGDHGSPYVNTDEHGIMVWFGDGAGHWSVYQNGEFGYGGVALGDVNGDGLVDVGYGMHHNYSGVDFGDQLLEVALGDGTGRNWIPWDDGLATNGEDWGMFSTDFADVDNDGDLDVGSISFGCCAGVHVYLNQGDGTWTQSFGFLGGNSQMHFSFGDVNGDGNADIAVSQGHGTVYLGDGTGNFALGDGNLPPPGDDGLAGTSLGDVNDDGRADLAFCTTSGGIQVWSWVAPGIWQNLSGSLPTSGPYEATQLFDMNMDGHLDVAVFGGGQLRIWGGDGAGGWAEIAALNTPTPGDLVAFRVGGDADHNGYPDIVIADDEGSWPSDHNYLHFFKESSTPGTLGIYPVFPRGGESLRAGGVVFVDWTSAIPTGGPGTVGLELSVHGPAGPWIPVAVDLPNGGRYQWHIPPNTPSTNDAYIRYTLSVSPDTAVALTPAPFNILGSFIEPIMGLTAANDGPTPLGELTHFTATVVSGTNVVYTWAFGDGATGDSAFPTHVYAGLGAYTAIVTASNPINTLTATTRVTVTEAPIAGLAAVNDSPTALGAPTTLTATVVAGTDVTYSWALGDGLLVSGPSSFTHTYPLPGRYTATVTATNAVSWQTAATAVVVEVPVAGLAVGNDSPTALGAPTTLTATVAAGTDVTYSWALGDGLLVFGPSSFTHTYPLPGLYTATVTATNAVSWQTATTAVVVEVPVAGLAAWNDSPTALGAPTTLTATVVAGTGVSYTWSFGDGLWSGPAPLGTTTHTYSSVGAFTATVSASNAVSAMTATTVVLLEEAVAGLQASNDSPTALGRPTTLTVTVTAGTGVSYTWSFGDGLWSGPAPLGTITHTYSSIGAFTATVSASNAVSAMTATTVVLLEEAVAGLQASNDSPTVLGRPTTLTAAVAAGTGVSYTWSFGDGLWSGPAPLGTITHTYPSGVFTATVSARNAVSAMTATTVVRVVSPLWRIYLPLVVR
jgi:PKD repeat protein